MGGPPRCFSLGFGDCARLGVGLTGRFQQFARDPGATAGAVERGFSSTRIE